MSPVHKILTLLDGYGRRPSFLVLGAMILFSNWFVVVLWRPIPNLDVALATLNGTMLIAFGALLGRHARMMLHTPMAVCTPRWATPILRLNLAMAAFGVVLVTLMRVSASLPWDRAIALPWLTVAIAMNVGFRFTQWQAGVVLLLVVRAFLISQMWSELVGGSQMESTSASAMLVVLRVLLPALAALLTWLLLVKMKAPFREGQQRRQLQVPRWTIAHRVIGPRAGDLGSTRRLRSPRSPFLDGLLLGLASALFLGLPTALRGNSMLGLLPVFFAVPMAMLLRLGWSRGQRRLQFLLPRDRVRALRTMGIVSAWDFVELYVPLVCISILPALLFGDLSLAAAGKLMLVSSAANVFGLGAAAFHSASRGWPYSTTWQLLTPALGALAVWRIAVMRDALNQWPFLGAAALVLVLIGVLCAAIGEQIWRRTQLGR